MDCPPKRTFDYAIDYKWGKSCITSKWKGPAMCPWENSKHHDHDGCNICQQGDPAPRLFCGCCRLGCGDCPSCYNELHESWDNGAYPVGMCQADDPMYLAVRCVKRFIMKRRLLALLKSK